MANLEHSRDLLHQGYAGGGPLIDTFNSHILAYMLIGFHAEGYRRIWIPTPLRCISRRGR